MKEFCISNIGIERCKKEHYAWIYLHALPPRKDCIDDALDFAVRLRSNETCVHAESTGDGVDIEYTLTNGQFRYAYDGIHGMVIECKLQFLESVKNYLMPFCTVEDPCTQGGRRNE